MRIVQLKVENIKKLKALSIHPRGAMTVIGGRNGQGKSSTLDAIAMALGGKDEFCAQPVRHGAKNGFVVLELDEMTIRRTVTPEGGGTLTITNKENAKFASPQAMLDKLVGKLSFDPLAFLRLTPKAQAEALRALVGLDFVELDKRRAILFDSRTMVNRDLKTMQNRLEAMPPHPNAPIEEVSAVDLTKELEARLAINAEHERVREVLERMRNERAKDGHVLQCLRKEITALESRLASLKAQEKDMLTQENAAGVAMDAKVAEVKSQVWANTDEIRQQIAAAEETNRHVRSNADRLKVRADVMGLDRRATDLTNQLEAIDREKQVALESAKFPVGNLSFTDTGITYLGLPFEQASSAEQLRVSVAIGLAMNPSLKVLLIRDGSLLDDESLFDIGQMAEKAGAQVWIERVGEGDEVSVVIEDGAVKEDRTMAAVETV